MRTGTWDGIQSTDNALVHVNGVRRPVKSVKIQKGMRDGHPAAGPLLNGSWCIEATIEWASPDDVETGVPEPFTGDSWLPRDGDEVVIETGEGQAFFNAQWFRQIKGVLDSTRGSIADGTATSQVIDAIEELQNTVSLAPLLATHTPRYNDWNYRRQGLQSAFMVDRMLRNMQRTTGWYATPPPTWQTIALATGMGSLRPEDLGELITAHRYGDTSGNPSWISTDYGVAPCVYQAEYRTAENTGYDRGDVVFSAGVPRSGVAVEGNHCQWTICNDSGDGVKVWYRYDTDLLYWQTTDNLYSGNRPVKNPATERRAERFALWFDPESGAILHLDDGRESALSWTQPMGWAATRVLVDCPAVGSWWMLEASKPVSQRWDSIGHQPTARVRQTFPVWWRASRGLQWTAPDEWLAGQVDAECAAMWLDEDGVMQWAGRDVLDSQPVVQTVTTTLQVDEIRWESNRQSLGRSVFLNYSYAEVRMRGGGHMIDCWEDGSSDLGRGEQDELTINIPGDEDWVSVDLNTRLLGQSTTPAQLREGSWHGGTYYQDVDNGSDTNWAIGMTVGFVRLALRSWKMTVASWSSNAAGWRIKTTIPDDPNDKLGPMHARKPALRIRSKAKVTWVEGEMSRSAGSIGPARYTHDVGWRVQTVGSSDGLTELRDWLADVVSSTNPVVTGIVLEHDPRRQIGDKIRIEDPHVTGVWIELLVQEQDIEISESACLDTIKGRITAWGELSGLTLAQPSQATAMTPPTDWTREVAP